MERSTWSVANQALSALSVCCPCRQTKFSYVTDCQDYFVNFCYNFGQIEAVRMIVSDSTLSNTCVPIVENVCRPKRRRPSQRQIDMNRCKQQAYGSMCARSRAKGAEVMSKEAFEALWKASKGNCAITGIRFSMKRIPGKIKRPWGPSVDRVDNSLGYVEGNCRLVCTAVNLALNEWGLNVLAVIAFRINDRYREYEDRLKAA